MKKELPGDIERKLERKAGLFILITVVVVLIVFFVIGNDKKLFKGRYNLTTTFDHGGNIDKNTGITLAGLNVGTVKNIYINDQNKIDVVMAIQKEYHELIRKDSVATLYYSLLTGSVIDISIGSKNTETLDDGGHIDSTEAEEIADKVGIKILVQKSDDLGKLIKTDLPQLFEMTSDTFLEVNNTFLKMDKLIERLDSPASELKKLIENMENFTHRLNKSSMIEKGDIILADAMELSANAKDRLPALLDKSEIFLKEYNSILNILKEKSPDLPVIIESIEDFIAETSNVLDAAKKSFLLRKHVKKTDDQPVMINEDIRDFLSDQP